MDQLKVKEARERARITSEVYSLANEGNSLFVQSACCKSPVVADQLHQKAQQRINKADELRNEFWDKYPQALIAPNCPWMSKDHEC